MKRLEAAGWLAKTAITPGMGGPLLSVTRKGAAQSGVTNSVPPAPIAPTWWAHWSACSWVAAWLDVRGREWLGEWELRGEPDWSGTIHYRDSRGSMSSAHRPDLVGAGNPIEVELTRKAAGRLEAILGLYESWRRAGRIAGVLYVVDDAATDRRVRRAAERIDVPIRVMAVADVVSETRAAAESHTRRRVAA